MDVAARADLKSDVLKDIEKQNICSIATAATLPSPRPRSMASWPSSTAALPA